MTEREQKELREACNKAEERVLNRAAELMKPSVLSFE